MTYTTKGWVGLLQDDSKKLSEWFASRIDARWVIRRVCAEIRAARLEPKKMTALGLADWLDEYTYCEQTEQAAAMLRKQHEAIKQLRGALFSCLDYGCMTGCEWVDEKAKTALAATEEI